MMAGRPANHTDLGKLELDWMIKKKYSVKDLRREGYYGIIWDAEVVNSGHPVVLKKIYGALSTARLAKQTYREIVYVHEFGRRHPNIIQLLNVHRASTNLDIYLVFPVMDNDLKKSITNSPELFTDAFISKTFYQILKAVKYLHSAEIIHRDLKPSNILLDSNYTVKLCDFGLARSMFNINTDKRSNVALTGGVVTMHYRPPEILLSCARYSKAVDIWCLGCVLAEMVLHKPVFLESTVLKVFRVIMATISVPTFTDIRDICTTVRMKSFVEGTLSGRKQHTFDKGIFGGVNPVIIDLIESLLAFHPNRRFTIEKILCHSLLKDCRVLSEETTATHPMIAPLDDNLQFRLSDYRDAIYGLIQRNSVPIVQ